MFHYVIMKSIAHKKAYEKRISAVGTAHALLTGVSSFFPFYPDVVKFCLGSNGMSRNKLGEKTS